MTVFLNFSIHPNIRSNISPFQKATTLILIPLYYNPSFHLWKVSKKIFGHYRILSWMPCKICDCDKLLPITPVTQFWLQAVT